MWRYTATVPATQEVEEGGSWSEVGQTCKILSEKQVKSERTGSMIQVVEALSVRPSLRPWVWFPVLPKKTKSKKSDSCGICKEIMPKPHSWRAGASTKTRLRVLCTHWWLRCTVLTWPRLGGWLWGGPTGEYLRFAGHVVPATAASFCHHSWKQPGIYLKECVWLCSKNTLFTKTDNRLI
jgi:hypothetical protein